MVYMQSVSLFSYLVQCFSMSGWKKTLRQRRYTRRSRLSAKEVLKSRRFLRFAKFAFVGVVILFISLFLIIPLFAFNLPTPDKVVRREGFSTKILDRNGKVLYDIYEDERRTPIAIDQAPLYLRQATIAIEDKNFYEHEGFDAGRQ